MGLLGKPAELQPSQGCSSKFVALRMGLLGQWAQPVAQQQLGAIQSSSLMPLQPSLSGWRWA